MRILTIATTFAIAVAGTPAGAVTVKAGVEAWQKGDFARAIAIWQPLASKGDADAQFNVGQAYRLGKGVPADSAQAKSWFERAAKANHLDAQVSLGLLLFDSGDRKSALDWLMKAAERGEPRALLVTGIAMFNGDELKRDPVRAYAHVSRAAAQGLEPAKTTLAEMDEIIPLEQRQQGVQLALNAAKGGAPTPPPRASTVIDPKKTPPTKVASKQPEAVSPAKKAPPATASGNWRIQLGAFSTEGAAQSLYGKLKGKLGGAGPYYVKGGNITRLQVGPYVTRTAANSACAALKPQACFAVEIRR